MQVFPLFHHHPMDLLLAFNSPLYMFMSEISSETGSLEAATLAAKQLRETGSRGLIHEHCFAKTGSRTLFRAADITISAHDTSTISN